VHTRTRARIGNPLPRCATAWRGVAAAACCLLAFTDAPAQTLELRREITIQGMIALRTAFSPDGRWILVSGMAGNASTDRGGGFRSAT